MTNDHGAGKDSNTSGNIFLPGIPTDSWIKHNLYGWRT
jgi:hypothetical protein